MGSNRFMVDRLTALPLDLKRILTQKPGFKGYHSQCKNPQNSTCQPVVCGLGSGLFLGKTLEDAGPESAVLARS